MFSILKGKTGDRAFRTATITALAILILFFTGIIVSLLTYTDWSSILVVIRSREIVFAVGLSLVTATISTLIAMIVAVPVAYAISKNDFPGKQIVDSLLDLPVVISPIAIGAALLVFFNTPFGAAINEHVINFVFAVPGIILAQFTIISALAIRLLKSTFDGIDMRYEQVGRTLGCSKPEAFFRIILPLAKNGLIAGCVLTWARAIGEFGASVTLAGAMAMKTETMPIAISLSLANADIEKAVAIILILVIIAITALILIRKITGKKMVV
ncbi:MAG: ABC transporter permease subunit [Dehalococcoidales bacterium]|nr:ABC transporter permease subunit [Dehalococcoidales bacterium]